MPHILLECSDKLYSRISPGKVGRDIHEIFTNVSDTFSLNSLRTRIVTADYHIADGAEDKTFAHITVDLLAGRDESVTSKLIASLNDYLDNLFETEVKAKTCLCSVMLREINPKLLSYSSATK